MITMQVVYSNWPSPQSGSLVGDDTTSNNDNDNHLKRQRQSSQQETLWGVQALQAHSVKRPKNSTCDGNANHNSIVVKTDDAMIEEAYDDKQHIPVIRQLSDLSNSTSGCSSSNDSANTIMMMSCDDDNDWGNNNGIDDYWIHPF